MVRKQNGATTGDLSRQQDQVEDNSPFTTCSQTIQA